MITASALEYCPATGQGSRPPLLRMLGLVTTFLVILTVHQAAAQENASIIGLVTDESGGVVPGVTVTATSPVLQLKQITVVTDARGEYRLTPLPIGTYAVEYTLLGFQSVRREGLRLTVGFVARADVQLKIGSFGDVVTVVGGSPVVDTTSTGTRTELTRETLELIPTSREGIKSLLVQTPGVTGNLDVGGSTTGGVTSFSGYGLSGESFVTLDGLYTSSSKDTQSGNFYDYSVLQEARVQAIANDVDVPVRGISVTAVIKSGSNQLHGGAFWAQTNDSLQSENFDEKLRAQGARQPGGELVTRWDRSVELGGKILEDKLWFYGSTRWRKNATTVLDVVQDDGSVGITSQNPGYSTEKISYQLNRKNHINVFHQWQRVLRMGAGANAFIPWESRYDLGLSVQDVGVNWQATPTERLVLSFSQGLWDFRNWYKAKAPAGHVATEDVFTTFRTGAAQDAGQQAFEGRYHSKGSVLWYSPDTFHGNHELMAGFDYWTGWLNRHWVSRGDYGNYVLLFNNGVPYQIRTQNLPVEPVNSGNYLAAYARDNWTIARRLTLNLGARFAQDHGFVPQQCRQDAEPPEFGPATCQDRVDLNTWRSVAPRLYAAYDLTGSGKTVIKGGWGRFDHMREIEEVAPFNTLTPAATLWTWHDLNGDRAYQPGEANLDPNGPDFISVGQSSGLIGTFTNGIVNSDEKQTKLDQFSLSLEQELMADFAIRLTGAYSRNFNIRTVLNTARPYDVYSIPITNRDPGADGKAGTADDPGTLITYYDYPAALAGLQFAQRTWFTAPGIDQTFRSFEAAATKRLSRGWQLMASYSATKSDSPFPEEAEFTPNAQINSANHTWEWLAKGSAAYLFPRDVTVSVRYEHRSGAPQARQVLFRGGQQIPSIVLNVEPIGTLRLPNINLWDIRAEKAFRLPRGQKVIVWLNVYNLLNANTVTGRSVRSGASYLRPTAFLPPRLAELSIQYRF